MTWLSNTRQSESGEYGNESVRHGFPCALDLLVVINAKRYPARINTLLDMGYIGYFHPDIRFTGILF